MKNSVIDLKVAVVLVLLIIGITWLALWKYTQITNTSSSQPITIAANPLERTDEQWQQILTPLQFSVLREGGTETPFTGEYLDNKAKGTYVTADCEEPVFSSEQKYDSKTGWPSFWAPIDEDAVELREDNSGGIKRIEVISKKCGSHLGHVFDDGPEPTGKRFCINSAALKFIPADET